MLALIRFLQAESARGGQEESTQATTMAEIPRATAAAAAAAVTIQPYVHQAWYGLHLEFGLSKDGGLVRFGSNRGLSYVLCSFSFVSE